MGGTAEKPRETGVWWQGQWVGGNLEAGSGSCFQDPWGKGQHTSRWSRVWGPVKRGLRDMGLEGKSECRTSSEAKWLGTRKWLTGHLWPAEPPFASVFLSGTLDRWAVVPSEKELEGQEVRNGRRRKNQT